jgi:hypothetical protein
LFPIHKLDLDKPLLHIDYAFHFFQTKQTLDFLRISKRVWGYDPYFMAGYPTVAVNMLNNLGATFAAGILSFFMPLPIAVKVFIITMLIIFPLIYFFTCRNFSFNIPQSLFACTILIFLLHFFWDYKYSITIGVYNFVFCSFAALFTCSCFVRYLVKAEKKVLVYYIVSGWFSLTLHPLSGFILLTFLFIYLAFNYKKIFSIEFKYLLLGSCFMVVASLYWIMPMIRFSKYYFPTYRYSQAAGFSYFFIKKIGNHNDIFFNFFLGCSLITPFFIKKEDRNRTFVFSIWVISLFMIFITYCKTEPIKSFFAPLQPNRYIFVSAILIPILIVQLFSSLLFFKNHGYCLKWIILFFSLILSFHFFVYSDRCIKLIGNKNRIFRKFKNIFCPPFGGHKDIADDIMGNYGEGLVKKILELTDCSGRILIEDSWLPGTYSDSFIFGVLQILTSREFIGGPYIELKIMHSFATFGDGKIFSQHIEKINIKTFMQYMQLYNIKWIFAHSKNSKNYFSSQPEYFQYIDAYKNMDIYSVNREASYFIEGSGNVRASLDRIVISNASQGNIIIKYHYLETLKSLQKVSLKAVKMLDDPIGFISIDNNRGFTSIEIVN